MPCGNFCPIVHPVSSFDCVINNKSRFMSCSKLLIIFHREIKKGKCEENRK